MNDKASSEIEEILKKLVSNFAEYEDDDDEPYWWGHDTNLGTQQEAFDQAKEAINRILLKGQIEELAYFIDHRENINWRTYEYCMARIKKLQQQLEESGGNF